MDIMMTRSNKEPGFMTFLLIISNLLSVRVSGFLPPSTLLRTSPASLSSKLPRPEAVHSVLVDRRHRGCFTHAKRRVSATIAKAADKNLFDYIQDEDLDTLRRYVERGGPVHVADTLGDTSLLVAACTGNVELMKILSGAEDADVNYPCFHGGETPLMAACTKGHLQMAEFLVQEAGAEVNKMNNRGDTALSLAAFWGRLDCLKFLLSLPEIKTEIQNVQGKRAGEGMEELMRDEKNDEETVALLREKRISQGITRL